MYEHCDVCHTDWKMIAKVETFDRDLASIAANIGIKIDQPDLRLNQRNSLDESVRVTKELFASLNQGQIQAMLEWFKIDFEAFDYDPEEIVSILQ